MNGKKRMKSTNDDIEEPVKKSWTLLVFGLLVLIFTLGIGVFLLIEALQKPENPGDILDMRRMMVSGLAVLLFSIAIIFFLWSVYKPAKKKAFKKPQPKRKTVRKSVAKRKTR